MDIDVLELVNRAIETSELIRSLSAVRAAVGAVEVVPLTDADIARLEKNGNLAADWSKVRVARGFDPDRVRDSSFFGSVVLGKFDKELDIGDGVFLPSGIYNSTLTHCGIGSNVLVRDVKLLANYVVREGAVLFDCGAISTGPGAVFGTGVELPRGGRPVGRGRDRTRRGDSAYEEGGGRLHRPARGH
jgi:hypothetical protein